MLSLHSNSLILVYYLSIFLKCIYVLIHVFSLGIYSIFSNTVPTTFPIIIGSGPIIIRKYYILYYFPINTLYFLVGFFLKSL